ncbi:Peptidoglycan/xylan/chitin deacetylase, PgdA/CDA1 family [Bhargavaea ginsengi]|uniref:Peptidoglycan/xylan/chitin deacetylase, PgdA/CDA1 family n=2 Tax=Bhargavaea ginsengi TaxID=426757 RepID=A0A1H6T4E2_9BACL|nr:Peptidoglycan/xylan/chitin deacetylase, PgdA/CDA1 family [Bhargavaea ginsengi]
MVCAAVAAFLLGGCVGQEDAADNGTNNAADQQDEQIEEQEDSGSSEGNSTESADVADEADKEESGEKQEPASAVPAEPAEPLYELNEVTWSFEPIGNADPKAALLTIDDAPDKHALEMAKTLKELDAPAIFFVNGHFIDTDEEKAVLKEIHEMGFPIGNHTMSHPNLKQIPQEAQREEILGVNEIVAQVTGEKPKFFRAPFGVNTDFTRQLAAEEGMLLMNWTYGYDWEPEYQNGEALADIMVNTEFLNNGANLLMHDREWTAAALPKIVQGLRDKGYTLIDPATIKMPETAQ